MPTGEKTLRSAFFLQFGHLVNASSLKDWTMSNWWSQSLHLYS